MKHLSFFTILCVSFLVVSGAFLTTPATGRDDGDALATTNGTSVPTSAATSTVTPAPTAVATGTSVSNTSNVIIVIEGPVRARQANIITIYNFDIQLASDDPMLIVIKIGDWMHVRANPDKTGKLVAIEVSNVIARRAGGSALVEGHVQAVNGNIVTINGINVQLAPNDPRLKNLKIGNFLSVDGNFQRNGTVIVLIVVNIIVVNDSDVTLFLYCREHPGMGMGMEAPPPPPGMGMGDGMGMGMGAPPPPPGMGDDGCRWP